MSNQNFACPAPPANHVGIISGSARLKKGGQIAQKPTKDPLSTQITISDSLHYSCLNPSLFPPLFTLHLIPSFTINRKPSFSSSLSLYFSLFTRSPPSILHLTPQQPPTQPPEAGTPNPSITLSDTAPSSNASLGSVQPLPHAAAPLAGDHPRPPLSTDHRNPPGHRRPCLLLFGNRHPDRPLLQPDTTSSHHRRPTAPPVRPSAAAQSPSIAITAVTHLHDRRPRSLAPFGLLPAADPDHLLPSASCLPPHPLTHNRPATSTSIPLIQQDQMPTTAHCRPPQPTTPPKLRISAGSFKHSSRRSMLSVGVPGNTPGPAPPPS